MSHGKHDLATLQKVLSEYDIPYTEEQQKKFEKRGLQIVPSNAVTLTKFIGEGTSAHVFLGTLIPTNPDGSVIEPKTSMEVAVKILKRNIKRSIVVDFQKELKVMARLKGDEVIGFYGIILKPVFGVLLEYCSNGSLYHVLQREDIVWNWERVFDVALQSVRAVKYLHSHKPQIVHRDLKSLNLLVTHEWKVKVCDFGLSRQTNIEEGMNAQQINTLSTLKKLRGTYAYSAPELYSKGTYTDRADIYSLGIILWELVTRVLTGRYIRPYEERKNLKFDFQIYIKVVKEGIRPTIVPETPYLWRTLMNSCFEQEPTDRPAVEEIETRLDYMQAEYNANKSEWDALLPKTKKLTGGSMKGSSSISMKERLRAVTMPLKRTTKEGKKTQSEEHEIDNGVVKKIEKEKGT